MKKKKPNLQYRNEDDRRYGLAGMLISLAACDALDKVRTIDIDSADGEMITFAATEMPLTAKTTWHNMVADYQTISSMMLSNIFSRIIVRDRKEIDRDTITTLYNDIADEGRNVCSLDDDEIRQIFDSQLHSTRRIYGNPLLCRKINELADILAQRRTPTASELREQMHLLQII